MVGKHGYSAFVLTLVGAGTLVSGFFSARSGGGKDSAEQALAKLRLAVSPSDTAVSPAAIWDLRPARELVEPATMLPQTLRLGKKEEEDLAVLAASEADCAALPARPRTSFAKAFRWQSFVCGKVRRLEPGFFEAPPFMHPFGGSFVARAIRSGRAEFQDDAWVRAHDSWSHLLECGTTHSCPAYFGSLDRESLAGILSRKQSVIPGPKSSGALWVRTDDGMRERDEPRYALIPRDRARRALAGTRFGLWSGPFSTGLRIMGAASLLAALCLWLLNGLQELRARRRRDLGLSLVAHEIRTPVTALRLELETLRASFDDLEPGAQKAYLRAQAALHRLLAVIDASRGYLSRENPSGSTPAAHAIPIESINEWVSGWVPPGFRFSELPGDGSLRTEPEKLRICLDNLMRNAEAHGKSPFSLKISSRGSRVFFEVEDHGPGRRFCPWRRRDGQQGLGLGLKIAKSLAKGLGGSLVHRSNPSRAILALPGLGRACT